MDVRRFTRLTFVGIEEKSKAAGSEDGWHERQISPDWLPAAMATIRRDGRAAQQLIVC